MQAEAHSTKQAPQQLLALQEVAIKQVNDFVRESGGVIKIEDVLPLFPDFVKIDNFKEAICQSLEDYNKQIDQLKTEMEDATRIADALRSVLMTSNAVHQLHQHSPAYVLAWPLWSTATAQTIIVKTSNSTAKFHFPSAYHLLGGQPTSSLPFHFSLIQLHFILGANRGPQTIKAYSDKTITSSGLQETDASHG